MEDFVNILRLFSISILLAVTFTVLKLTEVIDWGWGWIVSPIWIQLIIVVVAVFAIIIGRRK